MVHKEYIHPEVWMVGLIYNQKIKLYSYWLRVNNSTDPIEITQWVGDPDLILSPLLQCLITKEDYNRLNTKLMKTFYE